MGFTRPAFIPNPFELALCEYLNLDPAEVVAGSFETTVAGLVTWQHAVDDSIVQRTVKLEPATLAAVLTRADNDDTRTTDPSA